MLVIELYTYGIVEMNLNVTKNGVDIEAEGELMAKSRDYFELLQKGSEAMTGWARLPYEFDEEVFHEIELTAARIREQCSLMIVVGIGGSYLGAKAVFDALNGSRQGFPDLRFAGYNMSAAYLQKMIKRIHEQATCICVISKSGRTVEPSLTYSILKEQMIAKYGYVEARRRIYVITDEHQGTLHRDAVENGFHSLAVPEDIGGRYSVLSAVGLLPIAVAGHDIRAMIEGAASVAKSGEWQGKLLEYAVSRNCLSRDGKLLEVFEYFDVNLRYFGEWLKQLFGESEGKEGKGIYPTCLCFTRDLHSMGQFLQQGSQIFFETMIRVCNYDTDLVIPVSAGKPYAGKTLQQVNECAEEAVVIAHTSAGIPVNIIEIDRLDEYNLGALIYFFEMSCAISANNFGVYPFDQPGVEDYKREMRQLIMEDVEYHITDRNC